MKDITKELETILDKIGIRISLKGYKYWISAVQIRLRNPGISMGALYIDIAKEYDSTSSRVERALRHACQTTDPQKYFNLQYKINNSIFLECLAREVMKGEKEDE